MLNSSTTSSSTRSLKVVVPIPKCSICLVVFKSFGGLRRHTTSVHEKDQESLLKLYEYTVLPSNSATRFDFEIQDRDSDEECHYDSDHKNMDVEDQRQKNFSSLYV